MLCEQYVFLLFSTLYIILEVLYDLSFAKAKKVV